MSSTPISPDPGRSAAVWIDGTLAHAGEAGPILRAALAAVDGPDEEAVDGEGLFEVVRARNGGIEFAADHVDRISASGAALGIPIPFPRTDLIRAMREVAGTNPPGNLFLRILTIPCPPGSSAVPVSRSVTILIAPAPFAEYRTRPMMQGFRLVTSPNALDEHAPLSRHKTLRALGERRRARAAVRSQDGDDALVRNMAGRIAGATAANVHMIFGGTLVTPSIEEGAFPGIIRGVVLRAARDLGLETREGPIAPEELMGTSEVFLTSTILGLAPVASIDGVPLPPPTPRPTIPRLRIRVREMAVTADPGGRIGV